VDQEDNIMTDREMFLSDAAITLCGSAIGYTIVVCLIHVFGISAL
jgi:hypothetical protein